MPIRPALGLSGLMAAILLPGCADRFYEARSIEPEGTTSQACVERCARIKAECEARQTLREQECQQRVAAATGDTACAPGVSTPCLQLESCLGADMGICQRQHEACFVACGGRIVRPLRRLPWPSHSRTTGPPAGRPQTG